MILVPGVANKKIGVYGLGATGISAAEALVASGAEVHTFDESAAAREKTANTEYRADHPKDWPWAELSTLVLSPGVPLTHPKPHAIVRKARAEKVEIVGDIELFARALAAVPGAARPKVAAITGSNGKSTTTALTGKILKEAGMSVAVGGNIGNPVMALPAPEPDLVYVLELSSFQLDLAETFHADVAVMLNLSPDHLDRHGDMDGYARAKKRIFMNQTAADWAVVGVDDAPSQAICAELSLVSGARIAPISAAGALGRGVFALSGRLFYNLDGKTGEAGDISNVATLKGAHNWQNAAAALAAAMALGVSPAVAVRLMERYEGLAHRMEVVGRIGDVVYVNDSKATNADAASKALSSYDDIFWIAGGRAKEGGAASLRPLMKRVRAAYLIGEAAREFEGQLAGAAPCIQCGDLAAAVARAGRDAATSGARAPVVLLSPACASYDQFKNFEERGDAFRRLVEAARRADGAAA
jgi:UDP-N-acetylmuramoylalanine--D-glutamate ligase